MNLKLYTNIKIYFFYFFSLKKSGFYKFIIKNMKFSKSQIYQDLFILYFSKNKQNGTFIEIGGGNGVDLSNSYLLEKKYNWKGIICEPEKKSQRKIINKRTAKLETRPITNKCEKNKIFYVNKDTYQSTLITSTNYNSKIKVNTVSLNYLLDKRKFNTQIDYISIDTEGNEFEIIKNFNFKKYKVNFFTIEHNFDKDKREKIFKIMTKNNYKRVFQNISYMDDWYINPKIFYNDK